MNIIMSIHGQNVMPEARDIPLDVRVELVFSETVTPGMAANGSPSCSGSASLTGLSLNVFCPPNSSAS